jgi:hypothetical protein
MILGFYYLTKTGQNSEMKLVPLNRELKTIFFSIRRSGVTDGH